jgi:hypothetical protein
MKTLLLLYFPRSGSTFFASLLARYFPGMMVLPELRLPQLLLSHDYRPGMDAKQFTLDLINKDYQFRSLGLSQDEIEHCVASMGEYQPETLLRVLAETLAEKKQQKPKIVLYKCGAAAHWLPVLRGKFPSIGLIHVYRDARAAVCSAINTERPYHPGQKMGRGDPWLQSGRWRDYQRDLRLFASRGEELFEVRYESLVEQPERIMSDFADCFTLEMRPESGDDLEVSASEKAIHENVNRAPLTNRVDDWKRELKTWQGVVCELRSKDELLLRNYDMHYLIRLGAGSRWLNIAAGYGFHLYRNMVFALHKLQQAIAEPRKLLSALRLYWQRRKVNG